MQTELDEKLFKKCKDAFAYFEEYDRIGGRPDKRIPICITIPKRLKKKLESKGNVSRFIEKCIESKLNSSR